LRRSRGCGGQRDTEHGNNGFNCHDGSHFDRETGWVQLANLHQYRSLIPVDMLARKLAVSETARPRRLGFDQPARRWNAWQQMVDDACMGELDDHLIDNAICPTVRLYRNDLDIGRMALTK